MNATKPKKSQEAPRKKVTVQASKAAANATPAELAQQRAFWQSEIEAIAGQSLSSLEEAISVIVDTVLNRIGGSAERREEEKKFLTDLLLTDAQLCADVRSILKIS
ncbi:MAG: hypothetical protein J0M12_12955 [Deltaproteobacteria bacterium]|nr:hypothetical protein [Deltaproteobacteria bacterium]